MAVSVNSPKLHNFSHQFRFSWACTYCVSIQIASLTLEGAPRTQIALDRPADAPWPAASMREWSSCFVCLQKRLLFLAPATRWCSEDIQSHWNLKDSTLKISEQHELLGWSCAVALGMQQWTSHCPGCTLATNQAQLWSVRWARYSAAALTKRHSNC